MKITDNYQYTLPVAIGLLLTFGIAIVLRRRGWSVASIAGLYLLLIVLRYGIGHLRKVANAS